MMMLQPRHAVGRLDRRAYIISSRISPRHDQSIWHYSRFSRAICCARLSRSPSFFAALGRALDMTAFSFLDTSMLYPPEKQAAARAANRYFAMRAATFLDFLKRWGDAVSLEEISY